MANYRCTAACRHCLYACSPERTDGYITRATAESVCELLRAGGCRTVHIGGGEPFLDFEGLLALVEVVTESGIRVEYIETNAYWATDHDRAEERLRDLGNAGANTLCISIDPFHAEYVPVGLPLALAGICKSAGFRYFFWQDNYLPALSGLDRDRIHSRAELENLISPRYIVETAQSYGLSPGGRAIGIEAEYSPREPADNIKSGRPCRRLLSGGHFHVDMFGRFIPPGCTGIAVPLGEAVHGIPEGKYPVFEALLSGGSAELLRFAVSEGFSADQQGYTSSCVLCFHIRRWLCENSQYRELDPEHYIEAIWNFSFDNAAVSLSPCIPISLSSFRWHYCVSIADSGY